MIRSKFRAVALAGVALGAFGAPAFAAESGAGNPADDTTLEEVVVTAEKRVENLTKVAASVSAITSEKMEEAGLSRLTDYAAYIPGFNVNDGGSPGQVTVTLRGIAAVGPGSLVGFYLGDAPMGSSTNYARSTTFSLDLMPYDLERLEVLRGPQGTLYGSGAMGGIVKYVLKAPKIGAFSAEAGGELSYTENANGLSKGLRAAVNVPVSDTFAFRVSAYDYEGAGYTDNTLLKIRGTDANRRYGGRIAAQWRPTDDLEVDLNAFFVRIDSEDNAFASLGVKQTAAAPGALHPTLTKSFPFGELGQNLPFREPFQKSIDYYSATVKWDPGPVQVISSTTWSRTKTHQVRDMSATYGAYTLLAGIPPGVSKLDLSMALDKFSQEIRVVSPSAGRFEWMAGAFYTHEDSSNVQEVTVLDSAYRPINSPIFSPLFLYGALPTKYREFAVFGNATYKFSETFDITAGARFAHNDQDFRQISYGYPLNGAVDSPGKSKEDVKTWMVNARYHFDRNSMFYARVATGYRPGGPNNVLPGVEPTVNADTLISYEAGLKSSFWSGRAAVNATLYYIDWSGIQLSVNNASNTASYLANAGDAFSKGVELEGVVRPIPGLTVGGNVAYNKAELTRLARGAPAFLLGEQLPGVPTYRAGAYVEYAWDLGDDWRATVGATATYSGERWTAAPTRTGYNNETKDEAYTLVDLRGGFSNGRYSFNIFARNVTDERVYLNGVLLTDRVTRQVFQMNATPLTPRTVGVSASVKF
ncbi:TonB-dependent receptor [Caulobacter mirabilis]|uniref:TonB-dependent receptor n=1 Tax=Caulobacter mirabilis TaxID=69666 RepID=A0A2D2AZL0_9CAUL|nr:TonB-dependent receptor [Caulobacter mirabilis]ATQ43367.1 hypothetical protein CSW64_13560 [Caulobacter mirabilis]